MAAGVIGAGTMGTGIAYVLALAEIETWVAEPDERRAAELHRVLAEQAARGRDRGKLTAGREAALRGRVTRVTSCEQLPTALEVVIETVPERLELKRAVLREAEARAPELLASNTSSLSIGGLADGLARPEAFLGMHFFNPVWSLGLVEVIRGTATAEPALDAARALAQRIGKQAIVVADVPGFATSRLDLIAALEAIRMVQDGVASASDIDRAAELAYRHPVGPLRLSDIVGLDVRLDIAHQLERVYGERYAPPALLREMVADGRLGQKSGRGFYEWP